MKVTPWRGVLRRLAHRHRTLHAEEQHLERRLARVKASSCVVLSEIDRVRGVIAKERAA